MKFNNIVNKTALHIAVEKNNAKIVELLLSRKGIDIQIQNEISLTLY